MGFQVPSSRRDLPQFNPLERLFMKKYLSLLVAGVAALVLVAPTFAGGKKLVSGPQVGKEVPGPFQPLNVTGNYAGQKKCLYCEYGSSPVVMIFARNVSPKLGKLVKAVDKVTAKYQRINMGSCVVFLSDKEGLEKQLKKMAKKQNLKHTVLSIDNPTGPEDYKVAQEADLTVLLYDRHTIHGNHAFRAGELNQEGINQVLADLNKMLKQ